MPVGTLSCGPNVSFEELRVQIEQLVKRLPAIIARALTCEDPEGHLNEDEVEIRVRQSGPLDVNILDLALDILANDYPDRKANLAERRAQIENELCVTLMALGFHSLEAGVWVVLAPASYGSFSLPEPEEYGGR